MKKSRALAAVMIFASMPLTAAAREDGTAGQQSGAQQSGNSSLRQDIKNDASNAKHGIKSTARRIKEGIRNGAEKLKRDLAVAQCNDGRYSYTHHRTCNHHGGVKQQFR